MDDSRDSRLPGGDDVSHEDTSNTGGARPQGAVHAPDAGRGLAAEGSDTHVGGDTDASPQPVWGPGAIHWPMTAGNTVAVGASSVTADIQRLYNCAPAGSTDSDGGFAQGGRASAGHAARDAQRHGSQAPTRAGQNGRFDTRGEVTDNDHGSARGRMLASTASPATAAVPQPAAAVGQHTGWNRPVPRPLAVTHAPGTQRRQAGAGGRGSRAREEWRCYPRSTSPVRSRGCRSGVCVATAAFTQQQTKLRHSLQTLSRSVRQLSATLAAGVEIRNPRCLRGRSSDFIPYGDHYDVPETAANRDAARALRVQVLREAVALRHQVLLHALTIGDAWGDVQATEHLAWVTPPSRRASGSRYRASAGGGYGDHDMVVDEDHDRGAWAGAGAGVGAGGVGVAAGDVPRHLDHANDERGDAPGRRDDAGSAALSGAASALLPPCQCPLSAQGTKQRQAAWACIQLLLALVQGEAHRLQWACNLGAVDREELLAVSLGVQAGDGNSPSQTKVNVVDRVCKWVGQNPGTAALVATVAGVGAACLYGAVMHGNVRREAADARKEMKSANAALQSVTMEAQSINASVDQILSDGSTLDDAGAIMEIRRAVFRTTDNIKAAEANYAARVAIVNESTAAQWRAAVKESVVGFLATAASGLGFVSLQKWAEANTTLQLESTFAVSMARAARIGREAVAPSDLDMLVEDLTEARLRQQEFAAFAAHLTDPITCAVCTDPTVATTVNVCSSNAECGRTHHFHLECVDGTAHPDNQRMRKCYVCTRIVPELRVLRHTSPFAAAMKAQPQLVRYHQHMHAARPERRHSSGGGGYSDHAGVNGAGGDGWRQHDEAQADGVHPRSAGSRSRDRHRQAHGAGGRGDRSSGRARRSEVDATGSGSRSARGASGGAGGWWSWW